MSQQLNDKGYLPASVTALPEVGDGYERTSTLFKATLPLTAAAVAARDDFMRAPPASAVSTEVAKTSACGITEAVAASLRVREGKETNPKDLIGSDKLPLHLWPTTATALGCLGLLDGMGKYGRMNWREFGVSASVYIAACKRHLDAWYEGEECAPDSELPHLAHALACLAIIVDARALGKLVDDRAYQGEGYLKLVAELTPLVRMLRAKHADKKVHHYTIEDGK